MPSPCGTLLSNWQIVVDEDRTHMIGNEGNTVSLEVKGSARPVVGWRSISITLIALMPDDLSIKQRPREGHRWRCVNAPLSMNRLCGHLGTVLKPENLENLQGFKDGNRTTWRQDRVSTQMIDTVGRGIVGTASRWLFGLFWSGT